MDCNHKSHQAYRNAEETLRIQMYLARQDLERAESHSLGMRIGAANEAIERVQHGLRAVDAANVAVNAHFGTGRCKAVPA